MVELHIYLEALPQHERQLEEVFRGGFVPAITVQQGFRSVSLLKPHTALRSYVVSLRFDTEEQRQSWARSSEHERAFPAMAALCSRVTWQNHEVLDSAGTHAFQAAKAGR